jgi:hypothetical protein
MMTLLLKTIIEPKNKHCRARRIHEGEADLQEFSGPPLQG